MLYNGRSVYIKKCGYQVRIKPNGFLTKFYLNVYSIIRLIYLNFSFMHT